MNDELKNKSVEIFTDYGWNWAVTLFFTFVILLLSFLFFRLIILLGDKKPDLVSFPLILFLAFLLFAPLLFYVRFALEDILVPNVWPIK